MSLGPSEIILILVVVLIFFGPSRLPGLGKSVGEAIRGFKKGLNDDGLKEAAKPVEQLEANTETVNLHKQTAKTKSETES